MTSLLCYECKSTKDLLQYRYCKHIYCEGCWNRHLLTNVLRCDATGGIPREFDFFIDRWRKCPACQHPDTETDLWDKFDCVSQVTADNSTPEEKLHCRYCNKDALTSIHVAFCPYRRIPCPLCNTSNINNTNGSNSIMVGCNLIQLRDRINSHLRNECAYTSNCRENECKHPGPYSVSAMIAHREYHTFLDDVQLVKQNAQLLTFAEWPYLHGRMGEDLCCLLRGITNTPIPEHLQSPESGRPRLTFLSAHSKVILHLSDSLS